MPTECSVCGQPIKKADVDKVMKNLKAEIKKEQAVLKVLEERLTQLEDNKTVLWEAVEKAEAKLEQAGEAKKALDELRKEKAEFDSDVKVFQSELKNSVKYLEELNTSLLSEESKEPPKVNLEEKRKELLELKTKREREDKEAEAVDKELTAVNWWIDKAFSSSGLKAFVFSAMLNQLNLHIDKYAQRVGFRCTFSVDLSKASRPFVTTCYMGNMEVGYDELSGGQKQLLDCVVSFAMHDLVSSIVSTNILILDEIFEGLSMNNIEAVFSLLRVKADSGISVFVVTHSEIIDTLGARSIYISRDENNNTLIS